MFSVRKDFPILKNDKLVYLDSGATALKPKCVIKAVSDYQTKYSANVHRGIYALSERATDEFEKAREKVAKLINAGPREVIFTRNTTEAINLVAYSWGNTNLTSADNIVTTVMEHHSNFVPWQELAKRKRADLRVADITNNGRLDLADLEKKLNRRTKLLAVTQVSNVLGTINPIKKIVRLAHSQGAVVLVDGAQAVPHLPVDVKDLGCDFYVFSGHKMLGPSGSGVLWGKSALLEKMPPFLFGGSMIEKVTLKTSSYASVPEKFEAGTPDIAGAIGLGAAADYLQKIGLERIEYYESGLKKYAYNKLRQVPGLVLYGPANLGQKGAVFVFNIAGIHPHDLASVLDESGICVRAGHHCAQPLHARLGISSSVRASLALYNNKADIDKLVQALHKARQMLIADSEI